MKTQFNLKFFMFSRRIEVSQRGLQGGVAVLTVVLAITASYWGSLNFLAFFLGILGVIIVTVMLTWQINIGFILLLISGMFIPYSGPGGLNASVMVVIAMGSVWLLNKFIVHRRFEFIRSKPVRPAILFMIVSVIAFGMGQISWYIFATQAPFDAQLGGFAIYFLSLVMMIMTANIVKDIRDLKMIVWAFIGLSVVYIVGRLFNFSLIDQVYQRGYTANSMLWTWLIVLPLSQALFNHEMKPYTRVLVYLIVAATFYVAIIQANDWKSGWVPPLVGAGVLLGMKYKKLAIALIPFIIFGTIYFVQDLILTDEYSWSTRIDAWLVVLDISRTNPIWGLGFGNYYWYADVFTIRGYNIRFNSHSQYVDVLAQTGILGLFCFIWILYELGRLGWKLSQLIKKDGFASGYVNGVLAGVAGSIVAAFLVDWVLPFAYNIGLTGFRASILPWIFFGGLMAVEQMLIKNNIT